MKTEQTVQAFKQPRRHSCPAVQKRKLTDSLLKSPPQIFFLFDFNSAGYCFWLTNEKWSQ